MDAILAALEALSEQRASQMQRADASRPLLAKPEPVPGPTPPFAPTAAAPPSVAPPAAAGAPPSRVPAQGGVPAQGSVLQGMFEDGNSLLRAVIAAEVLGPPVALRQTYERSAEEPHFWKQQPNEPSI
jgi:hypothetical protein